MKTSPRIKILFSLLAVAMVALVARVTTIYRDYEPACYNDAAIQYLQRYGPKQYSYGQEESLIRAFFNDERGGYFVDVGASHYKLLSNTYYLEQSLGWRGIGIDAQSQYGADYLRYRPNTKYLAYAVGSPDMSGKEMEFLIDLINEYKSSMIMEATEGKVRAIKVPVITLD